MERRAWARYVLVAGAVLLVAAAVAGFANRSWISAQLSGVAVLSIVLEAPLFSRTSEFVTAEPRAEERRVSGVPATIVRPRGEGPHPTVVFMNGATPAGRDEPAVGLLAEGLARSGYAVYVPDLPGLRSGEITDRTLSSAVEVSAEAAEEPDTAGGRVSLVGVSVGASIALLAAGEPELEGRVPIVAGLAPYADLREVLRLATTGTYRAGERTFDYEVPDYLRLVAARSLAAMLPPEDGERLLAVLPETEHYSPPEEDTPDPLAALPALRVVAGDDELEPGTLEVIELLVNEDPGRFDRLYTDLSPRLQAEARALSPVSGARRLAVPVELVSPPRDRYFPVEGSRELVREAPEARLTVTPAISHAAPVPALDDVPALLRLNGFLVRTLREARLAPGGESAPTASGGTGTPLVVGVKLSGEP